MVHVGFRVLRAPGAYICIYIYIDRWMDRYTIICLVNLEGFWVEGCMYVRSCTILYTDLLRQSW